MSIVDISPSRFCACAVGCRHIRGDWYGAAVGEQFGVPGGKSGRPDWVPAAVNQLLDL